MPLSDPINPYEWENFFTEEAILVEELLVSGDYLFVNHSKIRIAIENKILNWEKYIDWIQTQNDYVSLKSDLDDEQIKSLAYKYSENKDTFKHYSIWSEDLIAVESWDDQLVILGVAPTDKLLTIPNAVFVLCPPAVLDQIHKMNKAIEADEEKVELESSIKEITSTKSGLLLEFDPAITKPIDLSFANLRPNNNEPKVTADPAFSIWNLVETKHIQHSDKARKQFDAYMVLKINAEKTQIFKMDDDLVKENLDTTIFDFNMNSDNIFSKIYKSKVSESCNLADLGLTVLDFKYAHITPLILGAKVLGFFVGFKISELSNEDELTLQSISKELAA